MEKEFVSFEEVLKSKASVVRVESYGYTERGLISSHFEPFKSKRIFNFVICRLSDRSGYLNHPWLILENSEENLEFERVNETTFVLNDPDLFARPEY